MSRTRIICRGCGYPLAWCKCPKRPAEAETPDFWDGYVEAIEALQPALDELQHQRRIQ